MDHCHHQRSPLRPRHPHRLGPILTPLDPPFPFLPYPHILSPSAHRAEFPAVPCAPEAFSRTGLTSCARGGGPMVLGHFCLFFPYLLEASPVYNVLRYSFVKGMGIFRDFLPYLRTAPDPCSTLFPTSNLPLRPSSRSAAHHSAVFCTERSRECLAYRKMPVFCTACIRKRLAYNRRPLFCTGRRIASRL